MPNGTELAKAYVQIVPSAEGIKGSISRVMGEEADEAGRQGGEKAGSMFSDADLLGIPLRLVVSPKTITENEAEFRTRACRDSVRFKLDEAPQIIADKVKAELAKFDF